MTIRREDTPPTIELSGLVREPRTLALGELHALESAVTHASGRAVPVGSVIDATETAAFVTFESGDGLYRASVPLRAALDNGLLLIGTTADGLPAQSGGPVRLVVPDGDTLCWNVKNVTELRVTAEKEPDSVPENPPH
jgi:DMSO/TMAO reductase YedYZ molybdopterin-dependent catalytic subunit